MPFTPPWGWAPALCVCIFLKLLWCTHHHHHTTPIHSPPPSDTLACIYSTGACPYWLGLSIPTSPRDVHWGSANYQLSHKGVRDFERHKPPHWTPHGTRAPCSRSIRSFRRCYCHPGCPGRPGCPDLVFRRPVSGRVPKVRGQPPAPPEAATRSTRARTLEIQSANGFPFFSP